MLKFGAAIPDEVSRTQDYPVLILITAAILLLVATAWVAGKLAYAMYPNEVAQSRVDAEFARIVSSFSDN